MYPTSVFKLQKLFLKNLGKWFYCQNEGKFIIFYNNKREKKTQATLSGGE